MEFIATCPTGFEAYLADELVKLGIKGPRPLIGQVSFEADFKAAYNVCLYTRLASRIIAVLSRFDAHDADALYQGVAAIIWEDELPVGVGVSFDAHGTNNELRSTSFAAQRAMDAIRDRMLAKVGVRVQYDNSASGLPLELRINSNRAMVGVIFSGKDPLFKRSYKRDKTHGLRADYAALMLKLAGGFESYALVWDKASSLQAELRACSQGKPSGLDRLHWGFDHWLRHDPLLWENTLSHARKATHEPTHMQTSPQDADVLLCDLTWLHADELSKRALALERLSSVALKARSDAHILCASHANLLPQTATETITTRIGKSEVFIQRFVPSNLVMHTPIRMKDATVGVLIPESEQFAARLSKVAKMRAKWARKEAISCYRVYDTDLPDYAVAIELYQGIDEKNRWLSISEYQAPKEIDEVRAQQRLMDVLAIAPRVLEVEPEHVSLRIRSRKRGGSQYSDLGSAHTVRYPILIDEGGLTFEVNFSQRLDCGIFLDHRETRARIREMIKAAPEPKSFLNLFAYTGTASCYAADGGAHYTTSVDLSRPSLEWAKRNMDHNGFSGDEHEFIQADVLRWASETRHSNRRFDLIFCDVPTFSNSSRMGKHSFDVQRDHKELLIDVSRLLAPGGCCLFSCNLRNFKADIEGLARAGVTITDISEQTIPRDFERNPKIHKAYIIERT